MVVFRKTGAAPSRHTPAGSRIATTFLKPCAMNDNAGTILLVEDDQNDVFFIQYAFEVANITNPLQIVGDGQQAIDYLRGAGKYADRSRFAFPSLVLLDLKLPYVHGFEVLRWTRQQPSLNEVSVVVLASSPEERDLQKARELGAKSYLVKPPTAEMMLRLFSAQPEAKSTAVFSPSFL